MGSAPKGRVDPSVSLDGQVVLITGANSGIGLETAVALSRCGADVTITARSASKGETALADIHARSGTQTARLMSLDLGSFASIRRFAEEWTSSHDHLHVLINNAGAILSERLETEEGLEMTFGVNHVGHHLLTNLLLDQVKASAPARIIDLSSLAHRFAIGGLPWEDLNAERSYNGTMVYNQSKLANLLHTQALARRLTGSGVTVNCCHPGPVRTGFGSADDTKGVERIGMALARPFLITPATGAVPSVYLATSPEVDGVTGAFFTRRPMAAFPGARVKARKPSNVKASDADRLWDVTEALIGRHSA